MATWYYFRRDGEASSFYAQSSTENDGSRAQITSPMTRSFFQTITKSFGTICLSSILLALLKTLHYLYRRSKNSKNAWVRAILNALLSCVESILRVFNLYALVRVGVRHEKYCDAAMATWELIKQRGVEALVNDDCVDIVMGGGRWIGAVTLAGVGFIASKIAYKLDWDIAFMVTVVSFFFGFSILSVMAVTVEMSAVTLFVLLAENPEAMLLNHPIMCRRLVHVIIDRCEAEGWVVPDEIKELAAETGQPLRRGI
ncbi:plasma-membrane choline transporter-domain-containing protein [Zopfochytrium polystomum]|nr:plasma-membrane choline transporter-domain-containing protein [Zopfochytrium polystomum]